MSAASQRAFDISDRAWIVAHLNRHFANSGVRVLRRSLIRALNPSASWDEILAVHDQWDIPVPIPENFDEHSYIEANFDVAAAVDAGQFSSGFEHFIRYGRKEKRTRFFPKIGSA